MRTVKCSIAWAMPNKWTFQIKPIHDFVTRWIEDAKVIVDPFCGTSTLATHRNDLAPTCAALIEEAVKQLS